MRVEGYCEDAEVPETGTEAPTVKAGDCRLSYRARLSVAMPAGPEVGPQDVAAGQVPGPLATILRRAVADAVRRRLPDVVLMSNKLEMLPGSPTSEAGGLLQFDWVFSFCAGGNELARDCDGDSPRPDEVDEQDFEDTLKVVAHRFAAFDSAFLKVRSLEPDSDALESQLSLGSSDDGRTDADDQTPPVEDEPNQVSRFWWLPWVLMAVAILVSCVVGLVLFCRRRRRQKKYQDIDFDSLSRIQQHVDWLSVPGVGGFSTTESGDGPGAFACVTRAFGAGELPAAGHPFGAKCVMLAPGELVEVEASSGAWLFGRVVGAPERAGFFPMDRVAWLGRPVSDGASPPPARASGPLAALPLAALPLAGGSAMAAAPFPMDAINHHTPGPLVRAAVAFSPQEADRVLRGCCLPLESGEVIEVLGAGAGWLYGRLVGSPERMGFFPEDRVEWVVDGAPPAAVMGQPQALRGGASPGRT